VQENEIDGKQRKSEEIAAAEVESR
jgi:hypothetical protein